MVKPRLSVDDLDTLADNYLYCRTYGHSWDDFDPGPDHKSMWIHETCLRCIRCFTERYDGEGLLGHIERRYYLYPEGYHLAGTVTRAQFRLAIRKRRAMPRKGRRK